ncbi:MAG: hypothetical protein M1118_05190 [Chloroflexi bacterium]|nr:hypothetical protein [Chloroflexota bacterium]
MTAKLQEVPYFRCRLALQSVEDVGVVARHRDYGVTEQLLRHGQWHACLGEQTRCRVAQGVELSQLLEEIDKFEHGQG